MYLLCCANFAAHKQTYDDVVGWKDPENNIPTAGASPFSESITAVVEVDKLTTSSFFAATSDSTGDCTLASRINAVNAIYLRAGRGRRDRAAHFSSPD